MEHPEYAIAPVASATIIVDTRDDTGRTMERLLVPKRTDKDTVLRERVQLLISTTHCSMTCMPLDAQVPFYYPRVQAYRFTFHPLERQLVLELALLPGEDPETTIPSLDIYAYLIKRFRAFLVNEHKGYTKRVHHDILVAKQVYLGIYADLKARHANKWVQAWPEKTDPGKFVYEDVGIAAFFIGLWKQSSVRGFVDLGCGNGLLVHFLASEGCSGYGVDLFKRKIWDMYDNTRLIQQAIDPRTMVLDPDVDWIIGNHADELTAWIPLVAARSAYDTKFVLIPCCLFDLAGAKSFKKTKDKGRYGVFLDYLEALCVQCGFVVEREHLRIPSTKNVALVCRQRTFEPDDVEARAKILGLVQEWTARTSFTPRRDHTHH
jgi:hypothetical protein